jgi:hypothetical protein
VNWMNLGWHRGLVAGSFEGGNELQSCRKCQEFHDSLSSRQRVNKGSTPCYHSAGELASTDR